MKKMILKLHLAYLTAVLMVIGLVYILDSSINFALIFKACMIIYFVVVIAFFASILIDKITK